MTAAASFRGLKSSSNLVASSRFWGQKMFNEKCPFTVEICLKTGFDDILKDDVGAIYVDN